MAIKRAKTEPRKTNPKLENPMKPAPTLLAAAVLLTAAAAANATLVSALGGQVVNDTDLNITWLANANYAKTSGYDADGRMTWSQAQGWIASLNAANHLGYHDWRLPTTLHRHASSWSYQSGSVSYGYNSTGSEMAHLYYTELGNRYNAGVAQSAWPRQQPCQPNDESLFPMFSPTTTGPVRSTRRIPNYAWYLRYLQR